MSATRVAVALGSNLDGPERHVKAACLELGALPSTELVKCSPLYRTAPVGLADQPAFINAVALIETGLAPRALLNELLAIERRHGRVRDVPNGPRTLDLDIVLFGTMHHIEPGLTIPHPRMHERAFVLAPLVDVWPNAFIAERGLAEEFLARADRSGIEKLETVE
jgi:2-amino-4-hydroxy-6-hydroxymethyldihydropteridine diphosphokinase